MSGPCDMGPDGDKIPYFWVIGYVGDDMEPTIIAESEDKNRVGMLDVYHVFSLVSYTRQKSEQYK